MLLFQSQDTEVFKTDRNKLFASIEKQIDNQTLMLDMLHSNMSVVCTYHCKVVFKNIFWCGCCSLLISGILQDGRVEDHRMMFTGHLHLPELYFQAILYIYMYRTDYMMSLTHYTLTSVCIFFILSSIHFQMCWHGICLTIRRFFSWLSFPLSSWP